MKCLLITTGAFHTDGGIAALNRLTLYTLAQAGCSIKVLFLSEVQSTADERYLKSAKSIRILAFGGNKYFFSVAAWWEVLSRQYDLIFVDHVNIASVLAPLAWLGLCKYAVWLCGIEVFAPLPDREGRLGLKNAHKRIAISEYTLKNVKRQFPDLQVEVCELALDPLHWAKEDQMPEYEKFEFESVNGNRSRVGQRLVLHVGRMASLERYKGQEVLLQALPLVKKKFPESQLMLVGQGNDRERLLAVARSLPDVIQDSIFMPGFMASELLNQIYQSCFMFAMPSVGEGFGLVYLEAMARGKPCIGGNLDATPCVVRDGVTGLLVDDPRSPEGVARGLMELLADPQKAEAMGRAGRTVVESHYLPEHFAARFWRALGTNP